MVTMHDDRSVDWNCDGDDDDDVDQEVVDDDNQEPGKGFEEERVNETGRGKVGKESRPGACFSAGASYKKGCLAQKNLDNFNFG